MTFAAFAPDSDSDIVLSYRCHNPCSVLVHVNGEQKLSGGERGSHSVSSIGLSLPRRCTNDSIVI